MTEHYLDNAATTRVLPAAAEAAVRCMTADYGNPSSLHTMGYRAKCLLEDARALIAKSLACKPAALYFTAGGTEANNLALLGAAEARKRLGNRIVTSEIEHPAVLETMRTLAQRGFEVVYAKPDSSGVVPGSALEELIDERTILVSLMLVNNETGAVQPVRAAADIIKRRKAPALLHTDAVQGYLKQPVSPVKLQADLITVSAHKVHGPKGVGALYVSEKARIAPQMFGGGQEKRLRPGTEPLPLIAAFAEAVQHGRDAAGKEAAHVASLRKRLCGALQEMEGVRMLSPADGSPYILSFSAGRVRAETMLHHLSAKGIFVSSGSACGKAKPSHVLRAMGVPDGEIVSALRVSFCGENTEADVDALIEALREGLRTLHAPR